MSAKMKPAGRDMSIHVPLSQDQTMIIITQIGESDKTIAEHLTSLALTVIPELRALHVPFQSDMTDDWYCKECQYPFPCDSLKIMGLQKEDNNPC